MDIYTKEKRSEIMSKVKSKDTGPEKKVRSLLHSLGFRYRLHRKDLPGKPDIVLPKYKTVIFVHGCFWHGHDNCNKSKLPSSNLEFWENKINKNKCHDADVLSALSDLGWKTCVIWECQINRDLSKFLLEVLQ